MRVLSSLLLATAMLVAVPALADTPTTEQVVAAAREAAIEAKSRYYMLEVARRTQEFDPEQALEDYRAAARMPVEEHETGGWALDSDCQVAEGLMALGEVDAAARLVRAGIDNMGEVKAAPTDDVGGAYIMQVKALCRAAEILYALDPAKANEALDQAHAVITKYADHAWYHVEEEALEDYLRALALKDPAGAYEQAKASRDSRHPRVSMRLVLNMLETDSASVMARLDEIMEPGLLAFRHPDSPSLIVSQLAATVVSDDPRRALDLAVKYELDEAPDIRQRPPLEPLAREMHRLGLGELPLESKYAKFYQRVVRDLARLDYEMAAGLAMCLGNPRECCEALASICEAVADSDLPSALDAAGKLVQLADAGGGSDRAVRRAANALAREDEELMGELLRRVRTGWMFSEPFGRWWLHHPEAAEALLPELTETQQLYGIIAILAHGVEGVGMEHGWALAQGAFGLPGLARDEWAASQLITHAAPFAPELGRGAWQALKQLDAGQADEKAIRWRLDGLLAVAEAFEQRERASSWAEVGELERMLEGAPAEAEWPALYRARLAQIYACYDGPLARSTAEQVIGALGQAPSSAAGREALSQAIVALSRVDIAAAKKLMGEREDLRGNVRLFEETAAGVARWRPRLAAELLAEVGEVHSEFGFPGGVFGLLARSAPAESVLAFLGARLDLAPRELPTATGAPEVIVLRQDVARRAVEAVLHAERPELGAAVLEYLVGRQEDEVVGAAVEEAGIALVLLSDEVLQALLPKLQVLVAKLEFIGPDAAGYGLRTAIAAVAERDWQGSQELLAALPPERRVQVLLMIPPMTRYRESLYAAVESW